MLRWILDICFAVALMAVTGLANWWINKENGKFF
jgi:hypothetical protein